MIVEWRLCQKKPRSKRGAGKPKDRFLLDIITVNVIHPYLLSAMMCVVAQCFFHQSKTFITPPLLCLPKIDDSEQYIHIVESDYHIHEFTRIQS